MNGSILKTQPGRIVKLYAGPHDGEEVKTPHPCNLLIYHSELYAYNGGPDENTFEHGLSLRARLKDPKAEATVLQWIQDGEKDPQPEDIPNWKTTLYYFLRKANLI